MLDQDFPCIVPVYPGAERCSSIQHHAHETRELLQKNVPVSAFMTYHRNPSTQSLKQSLEELSGLLPLVKWTECYEAPGVIHIFLLCPAIHSVAHMDFFAEMVGHWSIPGKHLSLLSTRHMTFYFEDVPDKQFFVSEIAVLLETDKDLSAIHRTLPSLVEEIRLGVSFVDSARRILESKGVSVSRKKTLMQEVLLDLIKVRPEDFETDVFDDMQYFSLNAGGDFSELREVRHLCRIVCAHYRFRKELQRDIQAFPRKRHVRVRLCRARLHYPFGIKTVMGIMVAINFLRTHELLEERHLLKAIERSIPEVRVVPESFFSYQKGNDPICCLYLELEKSDGSEITQAEGRRLAKQLPDELRVSVEQLVRSVVIRRNEEEVFQNILLLAQELKYVDSAPQLVMSYYGQTDTDLVLNVILVRILRKGSRGLDQLLKDLPADMKCLHEQRKVVGYLRRKYPKEANIFTIQVNKDQFLRRDHSIDLFKARRFVLSVLTKRVGDLRDYNGGLIWKQTELLNGVIQLLGKDRREDDFLLEDFFYSITPVVMQSLLPADAVKTLFEIFQDVLSPGQDQQDKYLLRSKQENGLLYLMIRADEPSFKDCVYKAVEELNLPEADLASAYLDVNGVFLLGCVFLNRDEKDRSRVYEHISHAMQQWLIERKSRQRVRCAVYQAEPILDPRMGTGHNSGVLIRMLYEGLHRVDTSGQPAPALAKTVHISNDQCLYTFKLRKSLWSNGLPVTAADFEYAWRKILDPAHQTKFAYLFFPIKNARAVKEGLCPMEQLGLRVPDEHTLIVELEHPAPYFLELTAHWTYSPLCREVEKIQPGWAYYGGDGYVCNGPYKLDQWHGNYNMELRRNPLYWDAKNVRMEEVSLTGVDDPHLALTMFENGELDWVGEPMTQLPIDTLSALERQGILQKIPVSAMFWYEFNVDRAPFQHKKMRRAFGVAINRRALVQFALHGDEIPTTSILPPSMSLQEEPYFPDGDLQMARSLFKQACEEMGWTLETFPPVTISYSHQEIQDKAIARCIAKQWEDAFGIKVRVEGFEGSEHRKVVIAHDFQVAGCFWMSWHNDPIYTLEYVKYRDRGINATQWEHPDYIRFLDKSNQNLNAEVRRRHLHEAEKLLMEEMPIVPLIHHWYRYSKRDHLKGVMVSNLGQIDFKHAYIEHAG